MQSGCCDPLCFWQGWVHMTAGKSSCGKRSNAGRLSFLQSCPGRPCGRGGGDQAFVGRACVSHILTPLLLAPHVVTLHCLFAFSSLISLHLPPCLTSSVCSPLLPAALYLSLDSICCRGAFLSLSISHPLCKEQAPPSITPNLVTPTQKIPQEGQSGGRD